MARRDKLNALAVQRAKNPGLYSDGDGLYLRVSDTGAKSWVFRFKLNGRPRTMGLGAVTSRTLAEAREKAREARKKILEGLDPIENRKAEKQALDLEKAKAITFDECALRYIADRRLTWKNAKHAAQWSTTLQTYASPIIGHLPIKDVDTALVRQVLDPHWRRVPETASRVRNRIELILDWATANDYRSGVNPARWRGHLDKLLPKRSLVQQVKHHAAMPYDDVPEFIQKLRTEPGIAPLALEYLILTGSRTGEVIGARWNEIDLKSGVWTIPATRMKAKREHRVPLSQRALEILQQLGSGAPEEFIFPGRYRDNMLSNMALLSLLRRMKIDVTAHGFRSSFRDWTAECTNFPRDVAETALAHVLKDKTEAAYRRGDLLEKRRKLMDAWSAFCTKPVARVASVTNIRQGVK